MITQTNRKEELAETFSSFDFIMLRALAKILLVTCSLGLTFITL